MLRGILKILTETTFIEPYTVLTRAKNQVKKNYSMVKEEGKETIQLLLEGQAQAKDEEVVEEAQAGVEVVEDSSVAIHLALTTKIDFFLVLYQITNLIKICSSLFK